MDSKANSEGKPVTLRLFVLRGIEVILDRDLAARYGVTTRRLNLSVKRNARRFPPDFLFQLTMDEWRELWGPLGIRGRGGRGYRPYAFTEQAVLMIAGVLRSSKAAARSVEILRAFARSRSAAISGDNQGARSFDLVAEASAASLDDIPVDQEIVTHFIQAVPDGAIEIGSTRHWRKRLRSLEMTSPVPLRVLGVVAEDIESYCHVALHQWRLHGEWFMPVPEVLQFIEEQLPCRENVN